MTPRIQYLNVNRCRFAIRGVGEGKPLFALHGLSASGEMWLKPFERAALGNVMLIAPDARAHGLSTATTDYADYSPSAQVRDWLAILDALEFERVALLGFSMGARVAAMLAANHPERIAALGIYAPPPHSMEIADAHVFVDTARAIEQRGFEAAVREAEVKRPDILGRLRTMRPEGVAPALGGLHSLEFAVRVPELAKIEAPTIVLGVSGDPHPLASARHYAAHIRGAAFRVTQAQDRQRDAAKLMQDLIATAYSAG